MSFNSDRAEVNIALSDGSPAIVEASFLTTLDLKLCVFILSDDLPFERAHSNRRLNFMQA